MLKMRSNFSLSLLVASWSDEDISCCTEVIFLSKASTKLTGMACSPEALSPGSNLLLTPCFALLWYLEPSYFCLSSYLLLSRLELASLCLGLASGSRVELLSYLLPLSPLLSYLSS